MDIGKKTKKIVLAVLVIALLLVAIQFIIQAPGLEQLPVEWEEVTGLTVKAPEPIIENLTQKQIQEPSISEAEEAPPPKEIILPPEEGDELPPKESAPPNPCSFWGRAWINFTNITSGDIIRAYDPQNVLCGSWTHPGGAYPDGFYGFLSCVGDDLGTPGDEGAIAGDLINFTINGNQATVIGGNATWVSGASREVNLSSIPVVDNPPTTNLVSPLNGNITTDTNNISFTCNVTDDNGLVNITFYWNYSGSWQQNGTVTISGTSNQTTFTRTNLNNGTILWNCLAYDNADQPDWADTNWTITISYSPPADNPPYWSNNQTNIVVTYSPTTQNYFNITWQDDDAVSSVWFESNYSGTPYNYSMNHLGSDVYNYSLILAAGTYYWQSHANDTAGQWNSSDIWSFIIGKATTILTLTATPSWNETYGTSTTVNCTANNAEVTPQLYLDGNPIAIPYTTTHAAGTYNYTCNTSATQNYTADSTSNNLTINKAATYVNLSLNGAEANATITYPNTITAVYSTNILTAVMYRNSSDVSGENNTPIVLAVGTYNYTFINPGNANYTGSSKTFFVTVQKNTSTCSLTFDPTSP